MNHPKEEPEVQGYKGRVISRSRHLADFSEDKSKCLPTYPGPGQRPDSDYFNKNNYTPPTDWPKLKSALKAPQVVWLTCETANNTDRDYGRGLQEARWSVYFGPYGTYTYHTFEFSPVGDLFLVMFSEYGFHQGQVDMIFGDNIGDYAYDYVDGEDHSYYYIYNGGGFGIFYGISYMAPEKRYERITPLKNGAEGQPLWQDSRVENPYKPIFDRMHLEVFPEVKRRLEQLRPGRTWVEAIDWYDDLIDWNDPEAQPNEYWNKGDNNDTYQESAGAYLPMQASHMDGYYGTDFLHICIGSASKVNSGYTWPGNLDDWLYVQERENVIKAYNNYAGFRVMLYDLNTSIDFGAGFTDASHFHAGRDRPPIPNVRVRRGPEYEFWQGKPHTEKVGPSNYTYTAEDLWILEYEPWVEMQEKWAVDEVNKYNRENIEMNKRLTDEREEHSAGIRTMAADLADFGYTYEGDGGNVTADELIAKIANHFRFDPSSGKDLD